MLHETRNFQLNEYGTVYMRTYFQLIYKYWLSIKPAIFVSLAGHISSQTDILSQVHFPGQLHIPEHIPYFPAYIKNTSFGVMNFFTSKTIESSVALRMTKMCYFQIIFIFCNHFIVR